MKAKHSIETGSRGKKMIKELWNALGIDPETTPDHLTLGEIGLESMFAVELQQEMEREYKIKISLNHIKTIPIGMMKAYEAGDLEKTQKYLNEYTKGRGILCLYKFIIPDETHTQLNAVKSGKPIYFLPPIIITFSAYEEFAKKFNRPVIGLNWTQDMNKLETIKELSNYYSELLKKLEPNGKYDLVGYLDGALVISKLLLEGQVNKAVIIDIQSDKRFKDEDLSDDFLLEFGFGFLSTELPEAFRDKVFRELNKESDFNAKVKRIVSEMKDFGGRALIATDLEEILHLIVKRARMAVKYRTEKKKKFSDKLKEIIGKKWAKKTGQLTVIKGFRFTDAEDIDEEMNGVRDVYLLPQQNVNMIAVLILIILFSKS